MKGTIDIARHIEGNTPFIGNVAYSQREFSYDNDLMELVRHTIEFIKGKPYGNNLLIRVKEKVKLVIEATPRYEQYDRLKIINANKKNAVRHAYFREYLALQRLCLLILQHRKHQIGTGSRQINGILFDGAWLWEEYVSSLIGDAFYHPMNKGSTYEANVTPRDDICLTKHGLKIPVDAKTYETFVAQMKVSENEFRQVFAVGLFRDREVGQPAGSIYGVLYRNLRRQL